MVGLAFRVQAEDPWSVSAAAPVVAEACTTGRPGHPGPSWLARPFDWALWVFQKLVSPGDGPRCGMYPTCSDFARQAVRRHGPVWGTFMAADRLMRDNGDPRGYPVVEKFGHLRLYDPVEADDFWWTRP